MRKTRISILDIFERYSEGWGVITSQQFKEAIQYLNDGLLIDLSTCTEDERKALVGMYKALEVQNFPEVVDQETINVWFLPEVEHEWKSRHLWNLRSVETEFNLMWRF
jgi:hypothetical protein